MAVPSNGIFPVREFGALGNGVTTDTHALQEAIDACGKAGGGQVLVSPGIYRTGTLFLRDRVDLHLMAGATLLGSDARGDYNPDDVFAENQVFQSENVSGAHLIIGHGITGASITGNGSIDGNSSAFFGPLPADKPSEGYRYKRASFPILGWRPGQMIWFCKCQDISVRDVSLVNSPYWTLMFFGCDTVRVRGLRITNPPETANGDGIDVDCCRDVTISDCLIATGDDCITLRGNPRALGLDKPCENVVVSNCVLRTPCNCVRVGVGDGVVRNCSLSNLIMTEARYGINVICRYSEATPRGTRIENINFDSLTMDVIVPLQILHGAEPAADAGIRNLSIRNVRAQATAGSYIGGNPDNPARGVCLQDWDLHISGGTDNEEFVHAVPYPYRIFGHPGMDGGPALPAAIYARYVLGLRVRNVRVHWGEKLGRVWRQAMWFEDGVAVEPPEPPPPAPPVGGGSSAVRLLRCAKPPR
jgi:polygalacturonase